MIKETENKLRIIFRRKPLLLKWILIQILDLSPGSSERNPLPAGTGGRWGRAEGPVDSTKEVIDLPRICKIWRRGNDQAYPLS